MARSAGLSVRLKLTLSYAGLVALAGLLLLAVVWVFLLRYVPDQATTLPTRSRPGTGGAPGGPGRFIPGRSDLWRAFAPKAAWTMGALLVLGLLGGWLLAGRMLAPLTRITDATRIAAQGTLSHRIHLEGRGDEFRELADGFDAMLARLETHVEEQRRFAANASHELRTPLSITQTLLDVARKDPDRDIDELLRRLDSVNSRAIDLTQALLLLSRADQRSFTRGPVELSLLAEEAAETLLSLAEERGVTLQAGGESAPTEGSSALLLQLTTNLVHNAIVHNLAAGGQVWVQTKAEPDAAVLTVASTGEPLGAATVATLVEPFQRGAGRARTGHQGAGLGLAIVDSIVRAHDGTLTLAARDGGGLSVAVRLPRA